MSRFLVLALVPVLTAADWPQFLGPNRDGSSTEKAPSLTAKPKVAWHQPVGEGHSSPVVADGVVYLLAKPTGQHADGLAAFDAKTGEKKWEKSIPRTPFGTPFGSGPRGTPTVAGGKVFTHGPTGVLACWDAKTGEVNWKVETLKEFKAPNLVFGLSASPLVLGNQVIVLVGGKGAGIVAFDTATGKPAWQATDDPASYASPVVFGTGDKRQIVALTGSHLRALSPMGKELWAVPFKDQINESSTTPVRVGDVLFGSSVTAGSIGLKLGEKDGAPTAEPAWRDGKLTCYFSTPVAVGKHLYAVTGMAALTKASAALHCVEAATGKVLWTKPNVGKYHASLLRTADDTLLMLDDSGNLIALTPDPTGYKEVGRVKICGPTWAHPALSDGKIFIRDAKELICLTAGE